MPWEDKLFDQYADAQAFIDETPGEKLVSKVGKQTRVRYMVTEDAAPVEEVEVVEDVLPVEDALPVDDAPEDIDETEDSEEQDDE
jgi:hypothetical protein|tara:strand:+ start:1124 stop:1378 length:255 start_codon:yes stop_codon:yes gene_type:complete